MTKTTGKKGPIDSAHVPVSSLVSSADGEIDLKRQLAREYIARQGAREHLADFMVYSGIAHPDLPRHARYICDRIERMFTDPDGPRILVVCQPPGTLKTTIARGVVAWLLARDASLRNIWATHRTDHAHKQSRMILELLRTPKFQALSKTRLSDKSQSAATFETTHAPEPGGMVALGSGSGARGYRVDGALILDDPAGSVQDAASGTISESLVDWYERDLVSRLLPSGKVLVFAQRLAERDLPGYLMRRYANDPDVKLEVITLQMRHDGSMSCPLGRTEIGELLWPEFFDEPMVRMLEAESMRWQSEYQQNPPSMTGGAWCIPGDVDIIDAAPSGLSLLASSDFALGESRGRGDWTVHWIAGLDHNRRLILLDCWRARDFDTGIAGDALINMMVRHKPRYWLHEDTTIERSIIPMLKERARNRGVPLVPFAIPTGGADKIARAEALQSLIRAGRVAMVRAPWNDIVLHEWYHFPGRNDDSVDAANLFARVIDKFPAGAAPNGDGNSQQSIPGVREMYAINPKDGSSNISLNGLAGFDLADHRPSYRSSRIP